MKNVASILGSPFTVKVTDALLDVVEVNAMSDILSCAVNKPARLVRFVSVPRNIKTIKVYLC